MSKSLLMAGILCAAAMCIAQTSSDAQTGAAGASNAQPASAMAKPQADASHAPQGPAIPATLAKSVDSKKAKVGDEIEAKTSVGMSNAAGVQIPEGSKIVGHITDVKAKSKGDPESSLAFSFEKIVLKNGQEMPFHAVAQAIGQGQSPAAAAFPENGGPNSQSSTGSSGGMSGGASPAVGSSGSTAGNPGASSATPQGISTPSAGGGRLPENATGVVGMKGLTLSSQANGSVVTSNSKSVKLDGGTQLLLRVISQ